MFCQTPLQPCAISRTCRSFTLLYRSLSDEAAEYDDRFWRIKPKLHMMVELCEYQVEDLGCSPEEFWAYRDESFVGFVAEFSERRGGACNPVSKCKQILERYRALSAR